MNRVVMKAIRLAAIVALVIGVVFSSAVSFAENAGAARANALYGAPKVGRCYDVSGRTASSKASISAPTVNCRTRHTLWVVAVTAMPERYVAEQHNGSPLKGKAQGYFNHICLPAVSRVLGGLGRNFAHSAYQENWFVAATAAQQKASAATG